MKKPTYLKLHLRELKHDITRGIFDPCKSDTTRLYCLDGQIVKVHEVTKHSACLVEGTVSVVLAHTILLKEVVLEHASNFECNLVVLAESTFTNKLDDFSEVLLFLKNLLRACTQFDETRFRGIIIMLENFGILGV